MASGMKSVISVLTQASDAINSRNMLMSIIRENGEMPALLPGFLKNQDLLMSV